MHVKQVVGACMAVAAAILSNVGTNIQKASHLRDAQLPESQKLPYVRRKLWWVGMIMMISAALMDFVALGMASQALVASLGGGTTLLCNVVVASAYNGDATYWTDVAGVLLIIGGAVYFGVEAEPKPSETDYENALLTPYFLIYLAVQLMVIAALMSSIAGSCCYEIRVDTAEHLKAAVGSLKMDDFEHDQEEACSEEEENLPTRVRVKRTDKFIYASCSGAVGGLSVLFGSITSSILQEGKLGHAFAKWLFLTCLLLMVICVLLQTHLLNCAMEIGDTTAVFPVFEAFWISFGVISGLVFYNTSDVSWTDDLRQVVLALAGRELRVAERWVPVHAGRLRGPLPSPESDSDLCLVSVPAAAPEYDATDCDCLRDQNALAVGESDPDSS
eukprot:TRINITY_DN16715_c0_g1_i4.p1 TRINITY_DN16715_c0_g1~~TRINITY_DN16715_c0_g1_i4.p1  ORF type:complete len:388 (-),score=71.71 TRINITY_DN16715_c0_g1_i4:282-1445(-)